MVKRLILCMLILLFSASFISASRQFRPESFVKTSSSLLKPVYRPLAGEISGKFNLSEKKGIAIDLGSGPGDLIVELLRVTKNLHWINADINPSYFPGFFKRVNDAGFTDRASAICADAKDLPFRNNYADIIISRGSFHLWGDFKAGLSEVYRVLKPGGSAYIGRGFSSDLPVKTAMEIRKNQNKGGKGLKYDVGSTASEMESIMNELNIKNFKIIIPKPPGAEDINYGIWLEFHKP